MLLYVRLWNLLDTLYMLVHNYDGDWTIGGEGWVGGRGGCKQVLDINMNTIKIIYYVQHLQTDQ